MTGQWELTNEEIKETLGYLSLSPFFKKQCHHVANAAVAKYQSYLAGLTLEEARAKIITLLQEVEMCMDRPNDYAPFTGKLPDVDITELTNRIFAATNGYHQRQMRELFAILEANCIEIGANGTVSKADWQALKGKYLK